MPIMIANPPVTRRSNAYFIPYPDHPQCGTLLNSGNWTDQPVPLVDECDEKTPYASCNIEAIRRWKWGELAQKCGVQLFNPDAAKKLLASRWVACVGDSIARNICASIMKLIGAPPSAFVFERHSDFERNISTTIPAAGETKSSRGDESGQVRVTFHWQPFPQNASNALLEWKHDKKPALIITSSTLWHMLHIRDQKLFGSDMTSLAAITSDMMPKLPEVPKPVAVLAVGTEVHAERLLSAEKRVAMTPEAVDSYNKALQKAEILAPLGPFGMLDMFSITYGCGIGCSVDGIHSQPQVYDAATQIVLNMFKQCAGKGAECWA
ncbi:hypothetical protein NADE_008789 [Nannochloris sp. 'desiccata']|nr:hypothetical protein NADE_008789 [Chlorella desiccata (nom. nud.)]